jgi:ATP-dependent Lhr-like helicase
MRPSGRHAYAEALLDRHGVVTRGAVVAERSTGGFAAAYRVLSAFEDTGRCRRGYFVEGLGAAQFAVPGAVDRMRALAAAAERRESGAATPGWSTVTPGRLAARALGGRAGRRHAERAGARPRRIRPTPTAPRCRGPAPWRDRGWPQAGAQGRSARRLVDGECVLYVERGGRTLLTWVADGDEADPRLQAAVDALALAVRDGALGRLTVERADGAAVLTSSLGRALEAAGFSATPRGLRLRS